MRRAILAGVLLCTGLFAQVAGDPARDYFTDVVVQNQHGEQLKLYSDLLEGRVVVIHSFFTSCEDACPLLVSKARTVQHWLGDRLGKDVYLISLSVDPAVDTPAALKTFADKMGARPGWHFVTGESGKIDLALRKLGYYVTEREAHNNIFLVGNVSTGLWKKVLGLSPPEKIIQVVDSVIRDAD